MAAHEELFPLLLLELPGCPVDMVRLALNRAAAEFCQRSMAWVEALEPVPVRPGEAECELELPRECALVVVRRLDLVTGAGVEARRVVLQPWGEAVARGAGLEGHRYRLRDRRVVVLEPVPLEAGALEGVVALKPVLRAGQLPDFLVGHYGEVLCEGARAVLKRLPGHPWSDPQGAALAEGMFREGMARARVEQELGWVRGRFDVAPRRFGV